MRAVIQRLKQLEIMMTKMVAQANVDSQKPNAWLQPNRGMAELNDTLDRIRARLTNIETRVKRLEHDHGPTHRARGDAGPDRSGIAGRGDPILSDPDFKGDGETGFDPYRKEM